MKDVIIPIGLLLFIGLMGFAMIHTARKQRMAKRGAFSDFAALNSLHYREEDDGTAQEFARDFDGIGRFKSSSAGKVIPKDVVTGRIDSMDAILFRHGIRYGEGWAREWYAAGLTGVEPVALRCSVQFCKGRDKSTMYLPDAVVKERKVGAFNMVVRAASPSDAGKVLDDDVLIRLADFARGLSFRPEIQFRGNRIVAYIADRNPPVVDAEILGGLFDLAKRAARV